MFPHERSLVTKYADKPFVLLGVNEDPELEELQRSQRKHELNWRSWWDGSTGGSIGREWKVRGLPTLFLIDHKGNVRWKQEGVPDSARMDEMIEKLIHEAESDAKRS